MATVPCQRCEGSGKVANSDKAEPWPQWEALPPGSDIMIRLGLVVPVPCHECGGSGKKAWQG